MFAWLSWQTDRQDFRPKDHLELCFIDKRTAICKHAIDGIQSLEEKYPVAVLKCLNLGRSGLILIAASPEGRLKVTLFMRGSPLEA